MIQSWQPHHPALTFWRLFGEVASNSPASASEIPVAGEAQQFSLSLQPSQDGTDELSEALLDLEHSTT